MTEPHACLVKVTAFWEERALPEAGTCHHYGNSEEEGGSP